MKIFIANCHTANRGDEAAVKSLVDELSAAYPGVQITLGMRGETYYPNLPKNVTSIPQAMPDNKSFRYQLTEKTKGKIVVGRLYTQLINEVKSADIVLHAPGGPSIGDVYYDAEPGYLYFYKLLCAMKVPYMFFAPSMGPFLREERNKLRRYILSHASAIALRDPISAKYVREFLPEKRVYQTLDSAFQHDIDIAENKEKLEAYSELCSFLNTHKRCVGITITDLLWHPVHSKDGAMIANIQGSFEAFLKTLVDKGYGIVFIPQLYGTGNDYKLMSGFATGKDNFFTIPDSDDRYDSYFQQYVIGQLYAVVGMRYHSNIFSAKMGTPFISVSYEQKMTGFMEKMELSRYCIGIKDLSAELLAEKFELLEQEHDSYKAYLEKEHDAMRKASYETTEILKSIIKERKEG